MNYDIADESLTNKGVKRIKWASDFMPVLKSIKEKYEKEKPKRHIYRCLFTCDHRDGKSYENVESRGSGSCSLRIQSSIDAG